MKLQIEQADERFIDRRVPFQAGMWCHGVVVRARPIAEHHELLPQLGEPQLGPLKLAAQLAASCDQRLAAFGDIGPVGRRLGARVPVEERQPLLELRDSELRVVELRVEDHTLVQ